MPDQETVFRVGPHPVTIKDITPAAPGWYLPVALQKVPKERGWVLALHTPDTSQT